MKPLSQSRPQLADPSCQNLVVIECQGHFISIARDIIINIFVDGHTVPNAPDLFRPLKLRGAGPDEEWSGGPPGKSLGRCQLCACFCVYCTDIRGETRREDRDIQRLREVVVRERERERERERTYRGGCRRRRKDDDEDAEEEE